LEPNTDPRGCQGVEFQWGNAMKKIIIGLVLTGATLATSGLASAQYYGPPRGSYYYDDEPPPPRRYYREYYGGPTDRRGYGSGIFIDPNGFPQCRRRGFTVQDGVCKPYRGG
jgi:hypothetical protein